MDLITVNRMAQAMGMGYGQQQANPVMDLQRRLVESVLTTNVNGFTRLIGAGDEPDQRRDLYEQCGYPKEPTPEDYYRLYLRNGYAARVVECLPKASWQTQPAIYETTEDVITPFEEAWDGLGAQLTMGTGRYGGELGSPVWEALQKVDILSGIGSYGVLLMGVDDGRELDQPVEGLEYLDEPDAMDKDKPPGKTDRKLLFLRAFPEVQAQVTQWEDQPTSPRFGAPKEYLIHLTDTGVSSTTQLGYGLNVQSVKVHWTRCLHVADNTESNPWCGASRMRSVLNYLYDIRKIMGSGAEGYYQGCIPGLSFETHPQLGGDVEVDVDRMKNQLENYLHGLQRYLQTSGMTVKQLAPTASDPTPYILANVEAVCVKLEIPVRIFKGSERGQLASSQDERDWNDKKKYRQTMYLTPCLIIPFIDRLLRMGVLPDPVEYLIKWPDSESQTRMEKAQTATARIGAASQYLAGGVDTLIPPKRFLTDELDLEEEEAEAYLEEALEHQDEKMQQEADMNQQQIDAGLVPDPEDEMELKMQAAKKGMPPGMVQGGGPGGPPGAKGGPPKPPGKGFGGGKPPFARNERTENVFCPTGPGGGIDPTCSPKDFVARQSAEFEAAGGRIEDLDPGPYPYPKLRDMMKATEARVGGPTKVSFDLMQATHPNPMDKNRVMVAYDKDGNMVGAASYGPDPEGEEDAPFKALAVGHVGSTGEVKGAGTALVHKIAQRAAEKGAGVHSSVYGEEAKGWHERMGRNLTPTKDTLGRDTGHLSTWTPEQTAEIAGARWKPGTVVKMKHGPTKNVFCPTGPRGGIDPTCSPGGGGRGKEAVKTKDVESGKGTKGESEKTAKYKHGSVTKFKHPPVHMNAKDTYEAYRTKDGKWTPERKKLHDEIKTETFKGKKPVKDPVAYVMGGGPASGKSTIINRVVPKENVVEINPDLVKERLPEYKTQGNNGAVFTHEESSAVSKEIQAQASAGKYNTLLDGTGDGDIEGLEKKIKVMRDAGQKVVAHYVTLNTDEAVRRSMKRAEDGLKETGVGRYVPEAYLRETHRNVSRVVPEAIKRGLFDEFDLWDTEVPKGQDPLHVATGRGKDLVIHDQKLWERFLAKANE